jgi:putative Mg2+ transporter-C (MgtC) family protein
LGAGAIIKDGAGIRGLNTAATLWCSAAVGACAGAGETLEATFVTVLLLAINVALRPLARFIDRHATKAETHPLYILSATCDGKHEKSVRTTLLRAIAERPLLLRQMRTEDLSDEKNEVSIVAEVEAYGSGTEMIDELANVLRSNQAVSAVSFRTGTSESE